MNTHRERTVLMLAFLVDDEQEGEQDDKRRSEDSGNDRADEIRGMPVQPVHLQGLLLLQVSHPRPGRPQARGCNGQN
jgi:hypothetical protein